MIIGPKGSGKTLQIQRLVEKYKITSMNVLESFLEKLHEEKTKWKRAWLLARGFKEPEPVEDGETPPLDPEIENDPDDFDKEAHEIEVFWSIFDPSIG